MAGDSALIVVNYGAQELLATNLDAGLAEADILVVVVDNFHSAQARAATRALCEDRGWTFVPADNDGFGAGVNRGVTAARELGRRVFVTLNPDAIADPDVLRALFDRVRSDPAAVVSPVMDASDGRSFYRGSTVNRATGRIVTGWRIGDRHPVWKNWLSGACLGFSDEVFDALDGFSTDYFLYWEDVDFSRRAAAAGFTLDLCTDLRVVHDEGGTQGAAGSRAKSSLYYYYNIRNRILFGRRTLSGRAWARWLLATPRESLLIWLRGGKKQLFTEPEGAWAAVRGLCAGLVQAARQK
jgi:GT2 family glycosyltransferase